MSAILGQPLSADLWRSVAGPGNMVAGAASWLSGLATGGPTQPSRDQFVTGATQSLSAGVGFTTRMLSAVGSVATGVGERVGMALDTVAQVATERGGTVSDNLLGLLGGSARIVGGTTALAVGTALGHQGVTRWGASTGADGLAGVASSATGMAVRTAGAVVGATAVVVNLTTGVVDAATGHPVKAYDLMSGNTTVGVSAQKRADATAALDAFRLRQDVPQPLRDFVAQLMALDGGADPDFHTRVLSGAHVVVQDGGARYDRWHDGPGLGVHGRSSSHYGSADPLNSGAAQRGFDVPGLGHVLFGTCRTAPNAPTVSTWFQFEGHGTSAREFIPHMADWVLHKASGDAQVGPLGFADHTEKQGSQLTIANPPALPLPVR